MTSSHQPKKSLGQNFLHERVYIERIVQAVDPRPGDRLVEIGPGQGAITLPLFSSVQLNAKLRIQQAQLDTAIAQYNKTVFEAISDAAQQLAQHRQTQAQVSQQARIVKNQQKLADLARQRYQAGMTPQMETLGLQAAALSAQDALYANYAARRLQEARLANSLGIEFSAIVDSQ